MLTTNQYRHRQAANTIAVLMLVQMVLGLLLNFYFLKPIFKYDGTTASESIHFVLGCATLIALFISSINLALGLLLPKAQITQQIRTFILLVIFAGVGIALCAGEYAQLAKYVTFLPNSFEGDPNMEVIRKTLASGRNEFHFLSIFTSSLSITFFYIMLLRASMLPKWLVYFAVTSCMMQIIALGHTFFQAVIPTAIQLPLAITQLLVPIHLLSKGFLGAPRLDKNHSTPIAH